MSKRNDNSNSGMHSQTVTSSDICLYKEGVLYLTNLIYQDTIKPKKVSVKIIKPRITLRLR